MATLPAVAVSPTPSEVSRFNRKFIRDQSGCWLWTAARVPNGYGKFYLHGKLIGAHRAAWIIHRGEIPDEMQICHKCDVRHCVNPDHLFTGTQKDNMQDMVSKGRQSHPCMIGESNTMHGRKHSAQAKKLMADRKAGRYVKEKHPRATITQETADLIRSLKANGKTCKAIAADLSVSFHVVRNVVRGKSWR